ncbi:MAG: aspartate kinase [Bacteroidetes bacterium]|nr:aspartate kinase [Bacteroidota bacterium]
MIVYKFGGASVKNADAVKNLAQIIVRAKRPLIVVISAMGKTTNGLEAILDESRKPNGNSDFLLEQLFVQHRSILDALFDKPDHPVYAFVKRLFDEAATTIKEYADRDYNFLYDRVISIGELVSTQIVSAWLAKEGIDNQWTDIRDLLKTDSNYREAIVDSEVSGENCRHYFQKNATGCYITQGFIGSDQAGHTTTLGREGSDYTAALLAYFLDAEEVILWKDVEGIYNADPAFFKEVQKVEKLDYQEVIELTYYGAKVIHPKTIKPLYDKQIPLYVKSFHAPEKSGTTVGSQGLQTERLPFIIVLENQVLISISNKDLSFISEFNLIRLFDLLHSFRVKANLMQHSAISFSFCVDTPRGQAVEELIRQLQKDFRVLYNKGLRLVTIRNYTQELINDWSENGQVLVEQRSRYTAQLVLT